jgi:uncharacterized protein YciI
MRLVTAVVLLLLCTFAADADGKDEQFFIVEFTIGEAWVKEKPANQQPYFAEHSANLKRMRAEGRLLVGGRFSDKGLLVVKGRSLEEVRAEVGKDASVANKTFNAVVYPFAPFYDGCVEREAKP